MKKIRAKFNSKCAETGKSIRKGDEMFYDYATKKAYHISTNKGDKISDEGAMCIANEEAYFDNFCYDNNI